MMIVIYYGIVVFFFIRLQNFLMPDPQNCFSLKLGLFSEIPWKRKSMQTGES